MRRLIAASVLGIGVATSALAAGNGPGPITIVTSCGAQSLTISPPDGQHFYMDVTGKLCTSASGGGGGGGTSATDESAFVAGTTAFTPIGGFFQTTATSNPLTNGQAGWAQLTANRAMMMNLRTAAGVEIGVGAAPLVDDITQWANVALGAPSNYGTSPGAVVVPGVNAAVTQSALPTGAGTAANQASILSAIQAPWPAGTNIGGRVGIDETTDGTTNGVRLTNGYPAGATAITASATGTTAATTATLAGASGKTTYICSYSVRANATAAATVTDTVTGIITATMSSILWVAPLASGLGVDEQIFTPCVPASGTNVGVAVVSGAPGSGGTVSVHATGYQQ